MGFLQRLSTVTTMPRLRGESANQAYLNAFWSGDDLTWISSLSAAGVQVTPELAMTLTAMYDGVTMIARDLATLPVQMFRMREDLGKDRVRPFFGDGIDTSGGIRSLAYMLRWQPNPVQTATEYWMSQVVQYLLRGVAYAEIVVALRGPMKGRIMALLPRHPDRIRPERLPSGRLRYRLTGQGPTRYLLEKEMHVVRDLSFDLGQSSESRVRYAASAIGTALATSRAAGKFFKSGMTASVVATYTGGQMSDEQEAALHASISRYASGVENSFGLMLIPDDITVKNLAIEPEKAQMIAQQEWGVREIARLLNIPGQKLGLKDAGGFNSQVQAALDYVISCLRPIAVAFEQAVQRDLIDAKDTYFSEFKFEGLLRGDFESQANYLEKFIRNRIMRPSEARLILNMNPDPSLDALSERDFQPGQSKPAPASSGASRERTTISRAELKGLLAVHDTAMRCIRRERLHVPKLAERYVADVEGWQRSLREFYGDHAGFVARSLRLPMEVARSYCAQHGSALEAKGLRLWEGDAGEAWERCEADELCLLSVDGFQPASELSS